MKKYKQKVMFGIEGFQLYEFTRREKSFISFYTPWTSRALLAIWLHDSFDRNGRVFVACYLEIFFIRIQILKIET